MLLSRPLPVAFALLNPFAVRICQGWCGECLFFVGSWLVENEFVNVEASPGRNGRCVCGAGW